MNLELEQTAKENRVPTLETCKLLDWQFETEKVWVKHYDNSIEVFTQNDLKIANDDDFDGIGYPEIIFKAPSFEEILINIPEV